MAVNGNNPWDIQVHHDHFYKRIMAGGSIALGESYVDGWWDCDALDQFFDRILRIRLNQKVKKSIKAWWCHFKSACTCSPGRRRAFDVGRRHYDIGNDLFAFMLDKWMNYSCAGSFRARKNQLWQIVFSRDGLRPGYMSVR